MDLGILPWLPIRGVCIREYFSLFLSLSLFCGCMILPLSVKLLLLLVRRYILFTHQRNDH